MQILFLYIYLNICNNCKTNSQTVEGLDTSINIHTCLYSKFHKKLYNKENIFDVFVAKL